MLLLLCMDHASAVSGLIALSQGDFKVVSYDANTDEIVNTYGISAGLETSSRYF